MITNKFFSINYSIFSQTNIFIQYSDLKSELEIAFVWTESWVYPINWLLMATENLFYFRVGKA